MNIAIDEIKRNYPSLPIKIQANPYSETELTKTQLKKFYSKYDVEIIEDSPAVTALCH
jgi:hypothetical protein